MGLGTDSDGRRLSGPELGFPAERQLRVGWEHQSSNSNSMNRSSVGRNSYGTQQNPGSQDKDKGFLEQDKDQQGISSDSGNSATGHKSRTQYGSTQNNTQDVSKADKSHQAQSKNNEKRDKDKG